MYNSCDTPSTTYTPGSGTSTDGSALSLTATLGSWKLTFPSGIAVLEGGLNSYSSGAYTDTNGNEITVSSGQYYDSLSSTTPVLSVSSPAPPSATTLTYTSPSGGVSYTINFQAYTVQTDFDISGIQEYGPLTNYLVSSISLPDGTSYSFSYEPTPSGASCTPISGTYSANCITGRIWTVALPTGGTITYGYTGGSNGIESDGSTAGFSRTLSTGGEWYYSRALQGSTAPGIGSTWTTTVEDPNSNYTVLNFSEDAAETPTTYNLYETERQVYQGSVSSSNLLQTVIHCYNGNYASCSGAAVISPIRQTDVYTELPNGLTRLSEVFYNGTFTGSGLISEDSEYNYGVTQGSAPGTTDLIQQTTVTYASLSNGIINKPSSVVVSDWTSGTAKTVSSTSYSYDQTSVTATTGTPQHTSVTGSRGNLTTLAQEVSSSTTLYSTFSYYDTGNLNTSTGLSTSSSSPGPTTTYNYSSASCGNSFITSISEPLSLSRSMTWNCTGGVVTQTSDENSQTVTTNYTDPYFWRPANVYDQEHNETVMTYSGQTAAEAELTFNGGNSVSDVRSTVDGFGRSILSQSLQGPGSTSYNTSETDYNNLGLPYRFTMPFNASAGGTSSSAPGVSTTYDALGRPQIIQDSDGGTTSYTYTNNDVLQTVSGSQTFKRQFEYDGLGRLTSVCEISTALPGVGTCGQTTSQSGYWTKYTYDALGDLLTVTQNAQAASGSQQSRVYYYDMLGRLTSESNPETGTVTYKYDSVSPCADGSNYSYPGNLVEVINNAGNANCYVYDALNRVVQAGDTAASNTILRKFIYDSKTSYPSGVSVGNGKAQMIEASTYNTSSLGTLVTDEFFSYSPRGELTDIYESTPHSGGYYHTNVSYWPSGVPESLSGIPSVPALYFGASNNSGVGLDSQGRYTQVTAGSGTNPVSSVTYSSTSSSNPLGSLISVTYGSSDSDSFTYDPNTGRQEGYTFSVNGSTDVGTLTWNTNGTLESLGLVDGISGTNDSQSCAFTYDDLGRIGGEDTNGYSVDCGSKWQQLFTYDAFGNIVKSGSSSFAATYASYTNQFTLSGTTVQYDANGNLLADNLNTYTWDANWGNMTSVDTGALTVTATYDALGRVVEQDSGSSYAETLWSPIGKAAILNGTTLTKAFVPLPGGGTAVYTSSGLAYYRHADWLGSSRLASTQARALYSATSYAPFGEQYATAGTSDASFTGENSDTVPSLYDFAFRRNSPSQGRWISPDPSGLAAVDPTNPQTFNRYAYASNNPLAMIDPSGLDDCLDTGEGGGDSGPATQAGGCAGGSGDDDGYGPGNPFTDVIICPDVGPCNTVSDQAWEAVSGCQGGLCGASLCDLVTMGSAAIWNDQGQIVGDATYVNTGPTGCAASTLIPGTGRSWNAPNNGQVPVHGIWTYGNWCGAGGSGTPINATDAACQQHDACYNNINLTADQYTSGNLTPGQVQGAKGCNQQLCNAALNVNRGSGIPFSQRWAGAEIILFFSLTGPQGARCQGF